MDKLKNQMIIYDDVCPMCNAYTGTFTQLGWLAKRIPFSRVDKEMLKQIDLDRGRHEIPLIDLETGKTIYGLDALFLIIGTRFTILKPLLRNPVFRFFWKQIYWVITYNRRIIAGSKSPGSGLDCAPDRHLGYRWGYIFLMFALTLGLLFSSTLSDYRTVTTAGLLAITMLMPLTLGLILQTDRLSWLGNWMTVLFIFAFGLYFLPIASFSLTGMAIFSLFMFWKRW